MAAGAGDGGSQVNSLDNKCWVLASNQRLVPEIWGAKGTGTDDDTTALKAALTYLNTLGSGVLTGSRQYGISSTITIFANTSFVGSGWDNSKILMLNGAFSPAIQMQNRTTFREWRVDGTPQTTGVLIAMGTDGADYRSYIDRVMTMKGCVAIDVNGISHTIRGSEITNMAPSAGCGGIRVGHNTSRTATHGQTVEFRLLDSISKCDFTQAQQADFAIRLEDSSGGFFANNDVIGCKKGTWIRPDANQIVSQIFSANSVQGDTAQEAGLLIDTAAPSAEVSQNMWTNGWTSASVQPAGQGIVIQNTGGGTIISNTFTAHRAYLNWSNAIDVRKPVSGTISQTVFDGLRVCGTQIGSNFVIGDNSDVTIRNSRIGKQCDNQTAGATTGLSYGIGLGANVQLHATGNDLTYTGAENWSPISGVPVGNSVVANNAPNDSGAGPSYAAAATVTLNVTAPRIHLTAAGAATVQTIAGGWNGQQLCVIGENPAGAITFGTGGNIRFPITIPTGGGMICGYYDSTFSKWIFK